MIKSVLIKMSFVAVCLLFSAMILQSCNSSPYAKHTQTVDSLQTVLTELNTIFEDIDYDFHAANRDSMMSDMQRVEQYFISRGDTMPRNLGLKLSDYRLAWKGYKRMDSEYKKLEQELKYSTEQLESLKMDLENKTIPEKMVNRFIEEEHAAISQLDLSLRSFQTKMDNTHQKYTAQKPVIVNLADSLQASAEPTS